MNSDLSALHINLLSKNWIYHLVLFSSLFYPLLNLVGCSKLVFAVSTLKFNPAFVAYISRVSGKSNLLCVTDFSWFFEQMFKWTDPNEHRHIHGRRRICETHVDGKTKNTASVGVGYRRICVSSCARIWRHWAPSKPLSTSRCDALYVGYDDGGEYVVALTPRLCMCIRRLWDLRLCRANSP